MTNTLTSPLNAEQRAAIRRINAFRQRFGEGHFYLAFHAALPLALTPDLLYCLWVNFQQDRHREFLDIPWIAVSDLILSNLCDEVGHELYEMDTSIRNELLKQLKNDSRFGLERIRELADFVLTYVEQQLDSPDWDARDLAETQKWRALAYKKPNEAAHGIALVLAQLSLEDKTEWIRRAALLETLAEPLFEYASLLGYAAAMADYARGKEAEASAKFRQIFGATNQLQVAGVTLIVPASMVLPSSLPEPQRELDKLFLMNLLRQYRPWLINGAIATCLSVVGVAFYLIQVRQSLTSDIANSPTPSPSTPLPSATPSIQPSSLQPSPSALPSTQSPIQSPVSSSLRPSAIRSQPTTPNRGIKGSQSATSPAPVPVFPLQSSKGTTTASNPPTATPTPITSSPSQNPNLAEADRLLEQGVQQYQASDYVASIQSWQQALQIYRAIKDRNGEATVLNNLGSVYQSLSQYDKAIAYYQQALPIVQAIKDRNGEANTLNYLGAAYQSLSQYDKAVTYHQYSLTIFQQIQDRNGEASAYNGLGNAHFSLNDKKGAIEDFQKAADLYQQLGQAQQYQAVLNRIKRLQ